ncbi:MAG: uracil-DNA glycosylase [Verrucomicrobiota bacterium]|nr:uracil-DNA glycosylase [Verrucomicrobiota bacterium]
MTEALINYLNKLKETGKKEVYISPETRQIIKKQNIIEQSKPIQTYDKPLQKNKTAETQIAESANTKEEIPSHTPLPSTPNVSPDPTIPLENIEKMDLKELMNTVKNCQRCSLCKTRIQTVFGAGDQNAELMFIGEGPGESEDQQGVPFVGRSGDLLTKMIGAMQLTRETVYIANIVKCRPPENRNPLPQEENACIPYLLRQIELIKPKVLVLLGAVPLKVLLNVSGVGNGINALHGKWYKFKGIDCLPTFHPAYLLRAQTKRKDAWEDLKKVMLKIGKDPKNTKSQK